MLYPQDQYNVNYDSEDESLLWENYYSKVAQANNLLKITGPEGTNPNPVRNAMARMVNIIISVKLTDFYGDIPYTEGGKGITDNIILPKYDTQEFIYRDIIAKIKECMTVFEGATNDQGYGVADPLYQGDLAKWIKFANTFRLRLAMRIRNVSSSAATTIISECLAKPLMTSNLDNTMIRNFATGSLYSGWYDVIALKYGDIAPSKMFVDQLKSYNDPRLPIFCTQNKGGKYKGMPNGINPAGRAAISFADSISLWSTVCSDKALTSYWITYAEVCFLKAEAALYGIGRAASAADANTFY